jgi:hypothetical protein
VKIAERPDSAGNVAAALDTAGQTANAVRKAKPKRERNEDMRIFVEIRRRFIRITGAWQLQFGEHTNNGMAAELSIYRFRLPRRELPED